MALARRRDVMMGALRAVGALGACHAPAVRAAEAAWPRRPVTVVCPLGAGSSPDVRTRAVAELLSAHLGHTFLVENRPGAGTTLATRHVARAAPDGHTLLSSWLPTYATAPQLYRDAGYDPQRSLQPLGLFSRAAPFLLVHPDAPARTLAQFLALARRPGSHIDVAHSGAGGATHLPAAMLREACGGDFVYVPYRSEADSLADLVSGRVGAAFYWGPVALPQVRAGRLRALAYAGAGRSPVLPEVPTFGEAGLPGFEFHVTMLLLGPAGLPQEVASALAQALATVVALPALRERFAADGSEAFHGTPQQAAARIAIEGETQGALLRRLGIRPA